MWTMKYWNVQKYCAILPEVELLVLGLGRTDQFAASVFKHNKDDRVENIYAEPRCDTASTRGNIQI